MADRRKLLGEIDRCLKKVAEGVETFEDTWQKVHNATNANQKEKYEADLKKEIKKLQRLRDQIKTWCASSEIKDKRQLYENRKLIETQMERFKVVERETKTKAYSKEGLGAAQKLDPIQKERDEITNWLSISIETLSVQVDQFESEIEALIVGQKKSKKDRDKQERHEALKNRVEKHRYHIKQLETLMRMLDNETVEVDQIKKIKDDIEYYIESSQDSEFQDNDYIYDDLDLEDMQAFRANNVVDLTNALAKSSSTSSASKTDQNVNSSSNSVSMDNDENIISNNNGTIISNSSSANNSPSPSPGLPKCNSTGKSTTSINNNSSTQEFNFITNNLTTVATSTTNSAIKTTAWSSTTVAATVTTKSSSLASSQQQQFSQISNSTPYAAAAASLTACSATKLTPTNEINDTRNQSMVMSNQVEVAANHQQHPSTSTGVTLYSAAVAAPTNGTSTASVVTSNPWNSIASPASTVSDLTNQLLNQNARQQQHLSNNNMSSQPIQLSPQQQFIFQQQQQQQQQQNNHILNGFKMPTSVDNHTKTSSLSSQSHQNSSTAGIVVDNNNDQTHHIIDNSHLSSPSMKTITANLQNFPNNNTSHNVSSNLANQMTHHNDQVSPAVVSQNLQNPSIHLDHAVLKNNLLMHQQRSAQVMMQQQQQQQQANLQPVSSISPPSNLNSVVPPTGTPTNNATSTNNVNNISSTNIDLSSNNNVSSNLNSSNNLVNSASQQQSQSNVLPFQQNQINKSALSGKLIFNLQLLETAYRHPIITLDSHRLHTLTRMTSPLTAPYTRPSHFPQQILPQFDNLEFYQRLSPETLFFMFYYMEGTKAQYFAAKTLKNKSWRFHTKFMMWFQRLEEPKLITDDYEQGTYIFFDYEKWSQRRKENFIFEYKYLEDKDLS